jgi:hypothetical protein
VAGGPLALRAGPGQPGLRRAHRRRRQDPRRLRRRRAGRPPAHREREFWPPTERH